jgi:adenylosuccinate synthase
MSNNTLILGLQWGDEGKGKIVDALAESSEAVCRFQGGHNAGHTLKVDGEQKVLHLVPSGILHPSVHCVLGNGLVLSLSALAKEIKELQESNISFKDRFYVSEDCSLILPTHIAIDQVRDKEEGIGTTGRGIGPAYEDKIARRAVRFGDLKNLEELKIKLSTLVNYHNQILQNLYNAKPIAFEDVLEELTSNIDLYNKYHCKTQDLLKLWVKQGKSILFEGAQGSMLDIDHGPIHMLPLQALLQVVYPLGWEWARDILIPFWVLPRHILLELVKGLLLLSYLIPTQSNWQRLGMNLVQQLAAQEDVDGWI